MGAAPCPMDMRVHGRVRAHTHTHAHTHVMCKQPFLAEMTTTARHLLVHLSLEEDAELFPSSLQPGAYTLWNSQKLAFVPFPSSGDRNLQDCCPGPCALLPTTGAVTPRHTLASPRHAFDGQAPPRPEGWSGCAGGRGPALGGDGGAGLSKSQGPSCTDERPFLFFGPEGSSGYLWVFFFLKKN